jgi:peptidoglycan-associated lipoprotein
MKIASRLSLAALVLFAAAACGKKEPEPAPAPQQAPPPAPEPAPPPAPKPEPVKTGPTPEELAAAAARVTAEVLGELATVVHFDFDKSDIRQDDVWTLDRKAAILSLNGGLRVRVSGHADERGSDEYNLALGNRRATAVKTYLVNKGVAADRIETVSFGEERPVASGHDEDSWYQNRRAEFEATAGAMNLKKP